MLPMCAYYNAHMPVNNAIYDSDAHLWWDDNSYLSLLRTSLNPARFGYFTAALERLKIDPRGRRALDIGCGGGLLAEEFARLGCNVTGIDPSARSVAAARAHAALSGLDIAYRVGRGEGLPFPDSHFDIVYCCDVLEHVEDLDAVLAETARVLKPGGLYLFDTINRTPLSWLAVIFAAQHFPLTRIFPPGTHAWGKFIRPDELSTVLRRHGIAAAEFAGLAPRVSAPVNAAWMLALKAGIINFGHYGRATAFRVVPDLSMNYAGWGVKA